MSSLELVNRCHYRNSAGRRCRLPRKQSHPTFCIRHARPDPPDPVAPAADHTADLLGPLDDFRTHASINYTLGRLLILKAANQISARDASVVAYICQLLLQSVPGVRKEISWSRVDLPENQALPDVLQATASLWDEYESDEPAATAAHK